AEKILGFDPAKLTRLERRERGTETLLAMPVSSVGRGVLGYAAIGWDPGKAGMERPGSGLWLGFFVMMIAGIASIEFTASRVRRPIAKLAEEVDALGSGSAPERLRVAG